MFPGRRKKEARERMEPLRKNLESLPPHAMASLRNVVQGQLMMILGTKAYEWVSGKDGRRFIMECHAEGVSLAFEEGGEEVTPDFMKK